MGDMRRGPIDSYGRSHTEVGAWTADVDVMLVPTRHPNFMGVFGGFEPAGYASLGLLGRQDENFISHNTPVISYGGLISQRLAGGLRAEIEFRYRRPLMPDDARLDGFSTGWQQRAGISFHFGGRDPSAGRPPRGGWGLSTIGRGRRTSSTPPIARPLPVNAAPLTGRGVVSTADHFVGTRYTYGGDTPTEGFDCSGFVQYVYARHGVSLPRTSRQMAAAGVRVTPSVRHLQPGDLVLFAGNGSRVDHVGIYAGRNRIVHASSSGRGVRYDDLSSERGRWFARRMVGARRVISNGQSVVDALASSLSDDRLNGFDPPDLAPAP